MIKRKGMTLVEILVVVTILILMVLAAVMAINPVELINQARDAQRKKDLGRIKISFEDYFNDKGCYPNQTLVTSLMTKINCDSQVFFPWLPTWPCDPKNEPYKLLVGDDENCPKWYKMTAILETSKGKQVSSTVDLGTGETVVTSIGVTTTILGGNVPAEIVTLDPRCWQGGCYYVTTSCNWIESCSGSNCYSGDCVPECKTTNCY